MILAYLDEAGNTGSRLDDPSAPFHMIAAVLIPEHHLEDVRDHLDACASKHVPELCGLPSFEYHMAEIFRGRGIWSGVKTSVRIALVDEALEALNKFGLKVIYEAINKPTLRDKYATPDHPHDLAMMFIAERINEAASLAGVHRLTEGKETKARALIVADGGHGRELAVARGQRQFQKRSTWGWKGQRLVHVVDSIHFVDSASNEGVQLADMVAWHALRQLRIRRGHLSATNAGNRQVVATWEGRISPSVLMRRTWP